MTEEVATEVAAKRRNITQRAMDFAIGEYTSHGWQVQISPVKSITSFTAAKSGKIHHVKVVRTAPAEGDKANFNQNAVSNRAEPILATYSEVGPKKVPQLSLYNVNVGRATRLVGPRDTT